MKIWRFKKLFAEVDLKLSNWMGFGRKNFFGNVVNQLFQTGTRKIRKKTAKLRERQCEFKIGLRTRTQMLNL